MHGQKNIKLLNYLFIKMEQSVPKRRNIKFRRQGITQKKAYNFQSMAKSLKSRMCIQCRGSESV